MAKARPIAARWLARQWRKRAGRDGLLGDLPVELGRFLHRRSRDPDGSRQRRADQERDAPAPALQAGLVHQGDGQSRNADREQGADFARRRGQRGDQAAAVRWRPFQQIGDDAGIFAADRETHHAAQQEQQPAGRGADLRMGRQQPPSPASPRSSARPTTAACAGGRCGRRYGRRRPRRAAASDKRWRSRRGWSAATCCRRRRTLATARSRNRGRG